MEVLPAPPIVPVPRGGPIPLSSVQERAWKSIGIDRANTFSRTYRISGPLDVRIFKECIADLFERHEILRATFSLVEGHPAQIVHASVPTVISFVDISDAENKEELAAALVARESCEADRS